MIHAPLRATSWVLCFVFCVLVCGGCGDTVRQGSASSYLILDSFTAAAGGDPKSVGNTLRSDVVTLGVIYDDPGFAIFRLAMKDVTNIVGPTSNNEITLTSYHVSYVRADGRNTPGVDVPYAFDGAISGTVKAGTTLPVNFVLVRAQAKVEAPLAALRNMGGAILISTIATVTFYGHDQVGNQVSVAGTMTVTFADWGDPAASTGG